jgi:chemotaxis protein CheD
MPAQLRERQCSRVDARIVVGVADLVVCSDPEASLVTYSLGSCIGVTLYDPVARVGGMLHFMLASSQRNMEKARATPAMFADTGVPMLFREAYNLGAVKDRLVVCAAGGAEVLADNGHFNIGSRNRTFLRKLFWKNGILLAGNDTGGSISRTLAMSMQDGFVTVRSQGKERLLWPD